MAAVPHSTNSWPSFRDRRIGRMQKGDPPLSKLICSALMSLDGYIEDETGNFDWAMPDAELHSFINDLEQPIGTHIYGRRMYETMAVWQTVDGTDVSTVEAEFATGWRAIDKVVYSRTLDAVSTPRTRLEREFEPGAIRRMKDAAEHDISIGGPELAQHAFEAGLVDEIHLFTFPVIIGGGKRALPRKVRLELQLLNERQLPKGVIYSHYRRR
jgi:dihydrofolate reductase